MPKLRSLKDATQDVASSHGITIEQVEKEIENTKRFQPKTLYTLTTMAVQVHMSTVPATSLPAILRAAIKEMTYELPNGVKCTRHYNIKDGSYTLLVETDGRKYIATKKYKKPLIVEKMELTNSTAPQG